MWDQSEHLRRVLLPRHTSLIPQFTRTGWDSNPRYRYRYTGFRDRLLQPLGHLSNRAKYCSPIKIEIEVRSDSQRYMQMV